MSNEWFKFAVAGVAVLALVVSVIWDIKIPGSGQTASVIDTITDTALTEPAFVEPAPADSASTTPIEPASVSAEPASTLATSMQPISTEPTPATSTPTEPASTTPTGVSNFMEVLQAVTESVKNFVEPIPVGPAPASLETGSLMRLTAPKGVSRLNLKVFVQDQERLESTVNNWFAVQEGIMVDQLNVQDYGGGGYLVVISYHAGGTGNSSTRLKLITGENSEADAQAFLSSLSASQAVRSVAATTGSYSGTETTVTVPIIFIVYE